ncbi:hypothetical protein V4C53_10485 [Paraburkholderia azotifigens]|uniref:hypothetical protein n=1 Tax=Paraburkholderia azotifigens TaxID=2057004 RepID=UPI00316CE97E
MISNTPTPEDFYTSGKELLNFAWNSTAELLINFSQADFFGYDGTEISESYWAAAKRTLTTALTVIQQAVELIIKGRIAEVSPYLLISDTPSRWPSPYEKKPVDFERFRTIDAQDLIKVHDTFASTAFDSSFVDKFQNLRSIRNIVTHSAGKNITVQVAEVVESALYMHKSLFPSECWFSVRREFLRNSPGAQMEADEFATNHACWEASIVKNMLKPVQVKDYLSVDKKQRSYFCPACLDDASTNDKFDFRLAVLQPKGAETTNIYCPVCNATHPVQRVNCKNHDCDGNVISPDSGRCLTCADWQSDM